MPSDAAAQAVGYDAGVSHEDLRDPIDYLTRRVEDLERGIRAAGAVAAGAKQTMDALRDELKQAKADLRTARTGQEG